MMSVREDIPNMVADAPPTCCPEGQPIRREGETELKLQTQDELKGYTKAPYKLSKDPSSTS